LKERDLDAAERYDREVLEVASLEDVRLEADLELSAICLAREDLKGAEEFIRSAQERATKLYSEDDPRIGPILAQRAQLLTRLGRCEEAAETYTRLIAVERERLGPTHPGVFALRTNHAIALHRAGRPGDAAKELAAILADAEPALGPESPDVWQIRYCLVSAREAANDLDGLEPVARAVVGFLRARFGVRNSRTLNAIQIWAHTLGHAGDCGAAADAYAEAARESEGAPGLAPNFAVICIHNAAEHYLAAGRFQDALGAARDWVARQPCADAYRCIARALLRTGDAAGAESNARKALEMVTAEGADTSAVDALLAEIGAKR